MNVAEFTNSIRKAWIYAQHIGIEQVFAVPTTLKASDKFRHLSIDPSANYEQLYLCGLQHSDYNILLSDYAYFQFGLSQQNELRFAYYPNPFLGVSETAISELNEQIEFVEEGIIDMDEYLHAISELRFSQHPPLVRYENDPKSYVELKHPCSHFHLGHHSENRWPVTRILNPAAFALFVMKLFYGDFWDRSGLFEKDGKSESLDQILQNRRQECQVLPDNLFSAAEKLQFTID